MYAKEADQLRRDDKVLAFNGPYTQHGNVIDVKKDHRGIRWICYWWETKGKTFQATKRHNSVYLPED